MHATAICPKDNVSEGELEHHYKWDDPKLQFGSFNESRQIILKHVEAGYVNMIVSGHSHRNIAMEVKESKPFDVRLLSAGEIMDTGEIEAKHIVMVSSSAGPFPKYLPGAPYICGCDPGKYDRFETGYFYDSNTQTLSSIDDQNRIIVMKNGICPACEMHGKDMIRKPPGRHKPGGNVLRFNNGKVRIQSVVVNDSLALPSKPRKGPICEKWGVMTEDMVLDGIEDKENYTKKKEKASINIISRKPFVRYNHMEFPTSVKYANFELGNLSKLVKNASVDTVQELSEDGKPFSVRISQTVVKYPFDKLMRSGMNDESMAFMRYLFNGNEAWDREIKITKHLLAKVKDKYGEAKTGAINIYEKTKALFTDFEPRKLVAKYDEFEGMVIEFVTIPDLKKRKRKNGCGY